MKQVVLEEKQYSLKQAQSMTTLLVAVVTFKVGDCVMVFMPSETIGKDRKLARHYHGPY